MKILLNIFKNYERKNIQYNNFINQSEAKMKKSIIFDLDGTLWNSLDQVLLAWNTVIQNFDNFRDNLTLEELRGYMGKTASEIAMEAFDNLTIDKGLEVMDSCFKEELLILSKNGAILYPNLKKTLQVLKKDYNLYIVSNCDKGYIECFLDYYNLWDYFSDIECYGNTNQSKGENIKTIINRNNLDKAVYVGDTKGDMEAAKKASIPFIYASYGFGDIDNSSCVKINSLDQIIDYITEII